MDFRSAQSGLPGLSSVAADHAIAADATLEGHHGVEGKLQQPGRALRFALESRGNGPLSGTCRRRFATVASHCIARTARSDPPDPGS